MDFKKLQEFMELLGRLKHMRRTGWVLRNITDSESIASHMYRMAVLSFLVDTQENLNKQRIMQMALVHDLAECIVGDITPYCGVSAEEKHKREDNAMMEICQLLGSKGSEILEIFREYESQESPEAKYVKDLDRLDLISQAYEYEKRDGTPGKLEEFFTSTVDKISNPFLKKMASEITSQREERSESRAEVDSRASDIV
ncbi:5'-deoxynucleotidase HDDC2 [Microplitis demolitor]|uniref:5'-deoxynucleotidase HDDC2 n=1 Tax=Microplitis demolitor TaxID=69319 RepID=UPI0004CCC5F6|nr:5'-deoxynucleotidase HDDC2 [Microplitis demolitor]